MNDHDDDVSNMKSGTITIMFDIWNHEVVCANTSIKRATENVLILIAEFFEKILVYRMADAIEMFFVMYNLLYNEMLALIDANVE